MVLYYLGDDGQASFFPSYLISLVIIGLLLVSPAPARRELVSDRRLHLAIAFIGWLAISPLWSPDPALGDWRYAGYAALLITFLMGTLAAQRRYPSFIDWFCTVMILSAAMSAGISVYLFYFVGYNPLDEQDRLFALGRNYQPTISALSYSVPLIIAVTRVTLRRSLLERTIFAAAALPLIWAIILTGTRGAWLGLLVAPTVAALVLTSAHWRRRAIIAGGIIVAFGVVVAVAFLLGYDDYILRRSTSFRPEIWAATIDRMAGGNWVYGHGINVSAAVNWQHLTFAHPHSIYLSTVFYGGMIGLGLLLALMLASGLPLLRALRSERHAIALTTLAFGVVTLAIDGNRLLVKVDHLWIAFWLPILFAWIAMPQRPARKS